MKTFIIATILSVGVLLRPEMAPTVNDMQCHKEITAVGAEYLAQPTATTLSHMDMERAQGSGVFECHQELSASGYIYVSCCLDLWFFRLCFEVNWSAVAALLPF